MTVKIFMLNQL